MEQDNHDLALAPLETNKPSVARMYDYYLGGKDNFQVDREAVDQVERGMPEVRQLAHENRAFLRRAVRYMVGQGVRQFIDIGSGLPTVGNTHEIAQEIDPDACVVYVDNDPAVLAFGRAFLAGNGNTAVVAADMRRPAEVLGHPETRKLIDFKEPVGVLLIAMVHFLTEEDRPAVIGSLRDELTSGSYLTASHATTDRKPLDAVEQVQSVYRTTPTPIYFRDYAGIAPFFDGFDLVEPGLVTLDQWRPAPDDPAPEATGWMYGGVGRKR